MKYHIQTKSGKKAVIEKELFNLISILATFGDNIASIEFAININYGHLPEYQIVQELIFDIKFHDHKTGLRNFNKFSSTEFFN